MSKVKFLAYLNFAINLQHFLLPFEYFLCNASITCPGLGFCYGYLWCWLQIAFSFTISYQFFNLSNSFLTLVLHPALSHELSFLFLTFLLGIIVVK